MIHPNYDYGKEGYIFPKISRKLNDYQFLNLFVETLSKMQKYCEDRQVAFVYCIEPSKSTVLNELLPSGVNYNMERYSYLIQLLESHNINYVDNLVVLREKSTEEMVFNKKFDAAHWNDIGAFYGTNEILKNLKHRIPEVSENKLSEYDLRMVKKNNLLNSNIFIDEDVPYLVPKVGYIKDEKYDDETYVVPQFKEFSYYLNPDTEKNSIRALMFEGSYFIRNPLIISNAFNEFIGVHNYENIVNLDYYFNIFKPDCVIFETAEYATTESYFTPDNLMNAVFTPSFSLFEGYHEVEVNDVSTLLADIGNSITTFSIKGADKKKIEYYLKTNNQIYNFRRQNDKYLLSIKNENIDMKNFQIIKVDMNMKTKYLYDNVTLDHNN